MLKFDLPAKIPSEIITYTIPFSSSLVPGESGGTVDVVISVASGAETTPTLTVVGTPVINSPTNGFVSVTLTGGTPGVVYEVTTGIRTTLNNLYAIVSRLAVFTGSTIS
jgi:hypothetical protein